MNRAFKIVWNRAMGAWVIVSELAKTKTKGGSKQVLRKKSTPATVMAVLGALAGVSGIASAKSQVNVDPIYNAGIVENSGYDSKTIPQGCIANWKFNKDKNYSWGSGGAVAGDASKNGLSAFDSYKQSGIGGMCSPIRGAYAATQTNRILSWSNNHGSAANMILGGVSKLSADSYKYIVVNSSLDPGHAHGEDSMVIGMGGDSWGDNSIAIGRSSHTNLYADSSIAVGDNAIAGDKGAVAIGARTDAYGYHSLALGAYSSALGSSGVAVGDGAVAGQSDTTIVNDVALGKSAKATGGNSLALGAGASADQAGAVALGADSSVAAAVATTGATINGTAYTYAGTTPASTVSVGSVDHERTVTNVAAGRVSETSTDAVNGSQLYATNSALEKIQEGSSVKYVHTNSTGDDSTASGTDSSAIGAAAAAYGDNAVALGNGAVAGQANTKDKPKNASTIVNDVALGKSAKATGGNSLALGGSSAASGISSVALGGSAKASGSTSTAIGYNANASQDRALALGNATAASGINAMAVGTGAKASGESSMALGVNLSANARGAIALGDSVTASGIGAIGIGSFSDWAARSSAAGKDSIAFGNGASSAKDGSVAIGKNASAGSNQNDVALGTSSSTSKVVATTGATINGTAYTYAGTTPTSTVSVGSVDHERTVTNVAAGRVSETSTDAVNGSQLYATNSALEKIQEGSSVKYVHTNSTGDDSTASGTDSSAMGPASAAYGDNAVALGNGAVAGQANTKDKPKNASTIVNDVALGKSAKATGGNSLALGAGASADQAGAVALGAGSSTAAAVATSGATINGTAYKYAGSTPMSTVSVGSVDHERTVTNMAAGRVSETSTDAVNGSQLYATNTEVGNVGSKVTELDSTVKEFQNGKGVKYINTKSTGDDSVASGADSTAIGVAANASGGRTLAIGKGASAIGADAVAQGSNASASGLGAVAQGSKASASGGNSLALGAGASADQAGAVALGAGSSTAAAVATSGVTINGTAYKYAGTTPVSTVSVGSVDHERTVTNVAAGRVSETSTDAVNGSQLYATNSEVGLVGDQVTKINTTIKNLQDGETSLPYFSANSKQSPVTATGTDAIAIGMGSTRASAINSIAMGNGALASGSGAIAQGNNSQASDQGSIALGNDTQASSTNAVALGKFSNASGSSSIAIGARANASESSAMAQGVWALASGAGSLAVGHRSQASETRAVALGDHSIASGINSLAAGSLATASSESSLALGTSATADQAGAVALGAGSSTAAAVATSGATINGTTYVYAGNAPGSTVSVGSADNERTVTNVAAGRVSETSTDVVNGSQLYATNTEVSSVGGKVTEINKTLEKLQQGTGVKYVNTNSTGDDSVATGIDSTAIGVAANAAGDRTLAIGKGASALGGDAVAQGSNASASGLGAVAQGSNASASGGYSVAQGASAQASGAASIAIGDSSSAQAKNAVAIGSKAVASYTGDVALGSGSTTGSAVATKGVVLNGHSYAFAGTAPTSTVSVGSAGNERTVTNVAAGRLSETSTDAVNGSQLYATNTEVSKLDHAVKGIEGGDGVKYMRVNSSGDDSVASGTDSIAIGPDAVASNANDVAIGASARTAAITAVASTTLGGSNYNFAGSTPVGAFSVGAVGAERQIQNVAAGRLSASSTDAVNGSQLYATNQKVQDNSSAISTLQSSLTTMQQTTDSGAASSAGKETSSTDDTSTTSAGPVTQVVPVIVGNNGTSVVVGPTATASNTSATAAGNNSQASGLNATAMGADAFASGAGSVAVGKGAKATEANSVALGQGSVADRANSVSVGSATNQRQITNVAAGTQLTDAVNVGQLNDGLSGVVDWSRNYTDTRVGQVDRRASAGVAAAMAMSSLPQAYQPDQSAAGVSLSSFRGEQAIAVGVSTVSESGRYLFKVNASATTRGDAGVAVGAGMVW